MAEHVVIKIDIDADTRNIERVRASLMALKAEATSLDRQSSSLSNSLKKVDNDLKDVDGHAAALGKTSHGMGAGFNQAHRDLDKFGKGLKKFGEIGQKIIKFTLKAMLVNLAAVSAALLLVSGAFTISRLAMKAWQGALTIGAVAAASMVSVLSAVVAGQREYNAALQAYNYKHAPTLSAGTQEAMAQMRGLAQSTGLAVLGTQALNQAFAAISRNTQVTGGITAAMRAMGDFAASSADPAKAIVAAGDWIGQLVKKGSITSDLVKSAADVGPAFAEALNKGMKDLNIKSSSEFMSALLGGKLSGGVTGQLDAVNNTLIGTLKRNFTLIKEEFADLGQGALPGFTVALQKIADIISTQLIKIGGAMNHFTHGTLLDSFVSGFEKVAKWASNLFIDYLPKGEGLFTRMADKLRSMKEWLSDVRDWFAPLVDGAKVLKDAFGPLFKSLFTEFGGGMKSFSKLLQENSDDFMEFGNVLKDLFHQLGRILGGLKEMFVRALPTISDLLSIVKAVVQGIAFVVEKIASTQFTSTLGLVAGVMGYVGLGKLAKANGGTGRGGPLSMARQALGGASANNVATMMVTTMLVTTMISGLPGGLPGVPGGSGGGTKGKFAAKTRGILGPMLASAGIIWGGGKLAANDGTGSNVAAGAALGAGLGFFIPGVGTLVGAGLGAAGGAIYDGVYGKSQRDKERARARAREYGADRFTDAQSAVENLDFVTANAQIAALRNRKDELAGYGVGGDKMRRFAQASLLYKNGKVSKTEFEGLTSGSGTYLNELEKQADELSDKVLPLQKQYNSNLDLLTRTTGKSKSEVLDMAKAMGIDLTAALDDAGGAIAQLAGITIPRTQAALMAQNTDFFLSAMDKYTQQPIAMQEAGVAVDQSMETLRGLGAFASDADVMKALRDAYNFELQNTYNPLTGQTDPIAAMRAVQSKAGAGGSLYTVGQLSGMEGTFGNRFGTAMSDIESQYKVSTVQRDIAAHNALFADDKSRQINPNDWPVEKIMAMTLEQVQKFDSDLMKETPMGIAADKLQAAGDALIAAAKGFGYVPGSPADPSWVDVLGFGGSDSPSGSSSWDDGLDYGGQGGPSRGVHSPASSPNQPAGGTNIASVVIKIDGAQSPAATAAAVKAVLTNERDYIERTAGGRSLT